jgi:TP901 family phage tail tape measure protein
VALSRLGFTADQIKQMQGGVLNFALAMGTDLGSAADFTGSALRAFGLQAADTTAMLDVMSASTTNSALDFSKLQTAIGVVAPIAKSFGLDVKETAAMLGVLANNGFDASSAATALRNILLESSKAGGKVTEAVGFSIKSFDDLIEAFKELQKQGAGVDVMQDLFKTKSAAAASVLTEQADAVLDLWEKLDGANGSLQQMADTMGDNLLGSCRSLSSAWEGLVLSLEDSKGPMKDVVDALTDILNRMTDIISKADKVTWYEALLGPIGGGLIHRYFKKGDPLAGGAGYAGGGSGGGSREAPPIVPPTPPEPPRPLTPAELKALQKAKEQTEKEILQMLTYLDKRLENNERLSVLNDLPKVNDLGAFTGMGGLATITDEFKQRLVAEFEGFTLYVGLKAKTDSVVDLTQEINSLLESSINRTAELMGNLIGTLAAGGDAWGGFKNAAVSALGDLAIAVGKIAIKTGVGMLGIQAALNMDNPYVAIAAGAALVALGSAVKSSLSAVASGDYSAGGGGYAGNYSSGYSGNGYETREVQVNVTGTLVANGDQLVTVINNTNKKNYYLGGE